MNNEYIVRYAKWRTGKMLPDGKSVVRLAITNNQDPEPLILEYYQKFVEPNPETVTPESLSRAWLESLESEQIELDNLDKARLVFDIESSGVMVENEYGTRFTLDDLSQQELEIFNDNI